METVLLHDSSPVHTLGAMSAQTIHRLASLPSSWGLEDFPADVFPGDYFPEIISQTYKIPVFFFPIISGKSSRHFTRLGFCLLEKYRLNKFSNVLTDVFPGIQGGGTGH